MLDFGHSIKLSCINPIPAVLAILAVPVVPIPKSTVVLCGSDVVPIPVWNRIELQCSFIQFYVVFAVPAVPVRESPMLNIMIRTE